MSRVRFKNLSHKWVYAGDPASIMCGICGKKVHWLAEVPPPNFSGECPVRVVMKVMES